MTHQSLMPRVRDFHDPSTGTFTYVVDSGPGTPCGIIDPVLDYDPVRGRLSTGSVERIARYVADQKLRVELVLETHVHADHVSAAQVLRERFGCRVGIGARVHEVQQHFGRMFGLTFDPARPCFDALLENGETFALGPLQVNVLSTPGHTPACVSYLIGDSVFVGDVLLMPERGTARCDFPGGSARELYESAQRLLALSASTRVYVCHDYPEGGSAPRSHCDIRDQRRSNIHLANERPLDEFIALRQQRDTQLALPRLIIPALQINIRGGHLPEEENGGLRYLKIPLDVF